MENTKSSWTIHVTQTTHKCMWNVREVAPNIQDLFKKKKPTKNIKKSKKTDLTLFYIHEKQLAAQKTATYNKWNHPLTANIKKKTTSFTVSSDPVQDGGLSASVVFFHSCSRVSQGFRQLRQEADFAQLFLQIGVKAVGCGLRERKKKKTCYSRPTSGKRHINTSNQNVLSCSFILVQKSHGNKSANIAKVLKGNSFILKLLWSWAHAQINKQTSPFPHTFYIFHITGPIHLKYFHI